MSSVEVVKIFDEEYRIKTSSDKQYVKQIANYVDNKMSVIQSGLVSKSVKKVAILAALNIADEYFKQKIKYEEHIKELEDEIKHLATSLDIDFDID